MVTYTQRHTQSKQQQWHHKSRPLGIHGGGLLQTTVLVIEREQGRSRPRAAHILFWGAILQVLFGSDFLIVRNVPGANFLTGVSWETFTPRRRVLSGFTLTWGWQVIGEGPGGNQGGPAGLWFQSAFLRLKELHTG